MKFAAITALFATAVSTVAAQAANAGIAFSAPLTGSIFTAGKDNIISWTVTNPAAPAIDVMELRSGPPNNLQVVTPNILTAPVTVDKQSYTWNIPANTVTSTSYALVAKNSKNPAAATYAGPFTILGAAPGTVNTTTPAAGGSQSVPSNGSGAAATTGSGSTPSGANGASSGTPAATPTNAANGLKAGMVGVAGAVGAAVLLF